VPRENPDDQLIILLGARSQQVSANSWNLLKCWLSFSIVVSANSWIFTRSFRFKAMPVHEPDDAYLANGNASISPINETRCFTGTIPYEMLLQIIERCDVRTTLKCSLNTSSDQLIPPFSDPKANAVTSRFLIQAYSLYEGSIRTTHGAISIANTLFEYALRWNM
jgi:hypothetical protein